MTRKDKLNELNVITSVIDIKSNTSINLDSDSLNIELINNMVKEHIGTFNEEKNKFTTTRNENIGRKIRELRTKKGWSLEELGDHIGKTKKTLSRYENGEYDIPSDILETIVLALDYEWHKFLIFMHSITHNLINPQSPGVFKVKFIDDIESNTSTIEEVIYYSKQDLYSIIASDNSMSHTSFNKGDLLIFRRCTINECQVNDIVVVIHNKEFIIRKLKQNGIIVAENSDFEPMILNDINTRIVGKIIESRRKLEINFTSVEIIND